MRITKELIALNNLQFIMVDMLEMVTKMYLHEMQKNGIEWNRKQKEKFSTMTVFVQEYLKEVRKMDIDKQSDFGEDSDYFLQTLLLMMDRSGDSFQITEGIINDIKARPSLMNFNFKEIK